MCWKSKRDSRSVQIEKELKMKATVGVQMSFFSYPVATSQDTFARNWQLWKSVWWKCLPINVSQSTFCKQLTAEYGGTNPHLKSSDNEVISSLKANTLEGMTRLLSETSKRATTEGADVRYPVTRIKYAVAPRSNKRLRNDYNGLSRSTRLDF